MSPFVIGPALLTCFEIIGLLKTRASYIGAETYSHRTPAGPFRRIELKTGLRHHDFTY